MKGPGPFMKGPDPFMKGSDPFIFRALLFGGGMMLGNSVWESTLQRAVPPEALSRVNAFDGLGALAFQPLGLVVWGPIAAGLGISASLWLAAALMAATTLVLLALPDVRRLGPAPS